MKPTVERISLWQLFTLIVTFEIGSAIIVNIGGEAKQDAWLAILLATLIAIGITWIIYRTVGLHPPRDIYLVVEDLIGRTAARVLMGIYSLYFFYIASRVLRDFGELISTAILIETPMEFILLTLVLVIVYILNLGIEVLARTAEVFAPYLMGFVLIISLLIMISGQLELKLVQPVLGEGVGGLVRAIFPALITFPFGEMIVFAMVLPRVTNFQWAGKVTMSAVGLAGTLLSISAFLQVASLGVDARMRSNFPLLSAVRSVSIANFIERIDAMVVFIAMLAIVMKATILFYAGAKGLEHVTRIPYRSFLLPIGMILSVNAILVSINFAEHIEEGLLFAPYFLHLPLQYGVPILLFLLVLWKRKRKGNQNRQPSEGGR